MNETNETNENFSNFLTVILILVLFWLFQNTGLMLLKKLLLLIIFLFMLHVTTVLHTLSLKYWIPLRLSPAKNNQKTFNFSVLAEGVLLPRHPLNDWP